MIEMGMGQDDGVDRLRLNRELLPVQLTQVLEPLKQTAVDGDMVALMGEEMLRSRDRSSRTKRFQ